MNLKKLEVNSHMILEYHYQMIELYTWNLKKQMVIKFVLMILVQLEKLIILLYYYMYCKKSTTYDPQIIRLNNI